MLSAGAVITSFSTVRRRRAAGDDQEELIKSLFPVSRSHFPGADKFAIASYKHSEDFVATLLNTLSLRSER